MIKKRLVYYFYIPQDENNKVVLKLHFACLGHFVNTFDEAIIILSADNVQDTATIIKYKHLFIDLGFSDIQFKIVKNDPVLREAVVFKNEIVDKLSLLDGITFFAHNKGTTNFYNASLLRWIVSMYFINLAYSDIVINKLCGNIEDACVCGFPMCMNWKYSSDNTGVCEHLYSGTFYWLNCITLHQLSHNNIIRILPVDNRFYAEKFPNLLFGENFEIYASTVFNVKGINLLDWHNDTDEYLKMLLPAENLEMFNEFYNMVMMEIDEDPSL